MDSKTVAALILIVIFANVGFIYLTTISSETSTDTTTRNIPLTIHPPEAEYVIMEPDLMTDINQSPVPKGWTTTYTGMYYGIGGVANVVLDTSVTHNGNPSIRIDPQGTTDNVAREANSYYLPISPGDHLLFIVYMKTSAAESGETEHGCRFGIDFYGTQGRLTGSASPDGQTWTPPDNWPSNELEQYAQWGSDWTQKTMDFTVADTYPADPWAAETYVEGQYYVPVGIIPWLQVYSSVDGGQGWFADIELYINPSTSSGPLVPVAVYCLNMMRR